VCFESGFTNLSYFNRQFKQLVKMAPQQYQKWKREATQ
jgi:AraC-like DNA-binding protein